MGVLFEFYALGESNVVIVFGSPLLASLASLELELELEFFMSAYAWS